MWLAVPALFLSFLLDPGMIALSLGLPWAAAISALAVLGALRFLARGFRLWHACLADIACLHAGGAAVWLLAQRGGISLLGFDEPWITWTAAHFLVDACLLLVVLSHFGRSWPAARRLAILACALVAAFWMTALGIQFSASLERAGAWLMATAAIWAAVELCLRRECLALQRGMRLLLDLAALCLVLGVSLALAYTFSIVYEWPWPSLQFMAFYHAGLNTLGFASLAIFVAVSGARRPAESVPKLTKLRSEGRIQPSSPKDWSWVDPASQAKGILDSLDDLAHRHFASSKVDPVIRSFYEDTASFGVHLEAKWSWFARPLGKLWGWWARRQGQVNFAPAADGHHDLVSEMNAVDASRDGRSMPRAWLRYFAATREVLYCAIYSTQPGQVVPLMNIGMPFRRFALTSVLQMDELAAPSANSMGLQLSTAGPAADFHCGIYVQAGPVIWRLPMHETLFLYPPPKADSPCQAKHEVRVFGLLVLTMHYTLSPLAGSSPSD